MEDKLKKLFDYQKFSRNPKLAQTINDAQGYFESICDDELAFVVGGMTTITSDNVESLLISVYKKNKNSIYAGAYLTYGAYRIKINSFSLGTVNYSVIKASNNQVLFTDSYNMNVTSGGVL